MALFSKPLLRPDGAAEGGSAADEERTRPRWADWVALPQPVWARVIVVFLALASLKLTLVAGLSKHLYETHWRTASVPGGWLNAVALCFFFGLGAASVVLLGRRCQAAGIKAVRAANAMIVVSGLLFVFLTFHFSSRNYLYPILDGTLKWSSLGPYLSLDLFFRAPYLAGWVLVYAAAYYVMARTGRERWMLHVTAAFGAVYGGLFLRDMIGRRDELLLIDALGSVCVVLAWRTPGKVRLAWLLVPAAWTAFFAFEILRLNPSRGEPLTYFLFLVGLTAGIFAAGTFIAHRRGYLAVWSQLLLFYCAAFLLLSNCNYLNWQNYGNLLCLGLGFPRYFIGELVLVGLLALCAGVAVRLRPRASLWWMDVAGLLLCVGAFVDLRLSQIMGVRLGWDVLTFGNSPKMMWRMAKPYLPGVLVALALTVGLYLAALKLLEQWQRRSSPGSAGGGAGQGVSWLAAIFVALALVSLALADADKAEGQAELRLVASSPLWQRVTNRVLSPEEFLNSARALGLGDFAASPAPAQPPRELNVVLVFLESTYNKHLSLFSGDEQTQPLLSKYKDRMEVFPNFFSCFAGSIHARFATFTSLYPVHEYNAFTLHRVPVKSMFEVLHDHGYGCSMFYSSYFDYTGFGDFLKGRGLDELHDADSMPGEHRGKKVAWGLREEETLEAMRGRLKEYAARKQRFFMTYVPAAPHYPYDNLPEAFRKFSMVEMSDYRPAYLNELLYIDWVLASIVGQLKDSGLLDNTLVIITNDHGEMLGGKDGRIGHGWAITPELANTPLIIMDPQRPGWHINYTTGSQVDLLPTLLDRLRLPSPADQLYEGRSLDAPERGGRLAYLNSYSQFGILAGNRIFTSQVEPRRGGDESLSGFLITNDGTKTQFNPDPAAGLTSSIAKFNEFQESLLRNYAYYCERLRKGTAVPVRATPEVAQNPSKGR